MGAAEPAPDVICTSKRWALSHHGESWNNRASGQKNLPLPKSYPDGYQVHSLSRRTYNRGGQNKNLDLVPSRFSHRFYRDRTKRSFYRTEVDPLISRFEYFCRYRIQKGLTNQALLSIFFAVLCSIWLWIIKLRMMRSRDVFFKMAEKLDRRTVWKLRLWSISRTYNLSIQTLSFTIQTLLYSVQTQRAKHVKNIQPSIGFRLKGIKHHYPLQRIYREQCYDF